MRLAMLALLLSIVFLLPTFARADHPPCLHSQEASELESVPSSIERLNLLRLYGRMTVGELIANVENYRPMQEGGYPAPVEEREELKRLLRYWISVKSSYWCVMVTSIHEVRELEDVHGEARCMLEDMHSETQSFVPRIRETRKKVEFYKELHRKVYSAIEVTEDLAAEIRDALAREGHPVPMG